MIRGLPGRKRGEFAISGEMFTKEKGPFHSDNLVNIGAMRILWTVRSFRSALHPVFSDNNAILERRLCALGGPRHREGTRTLPGPVLRKSAPVPLQRLRPASPRRSMYRFERHRRRFHTSPAWAGRLLPHRLPQVLESKTRRELAVIPLNKEKWGNKVAPRNTCPACRLTGRSEGGGRPGPGDNDGLACDCLVRRVAPWC
jgi:hypothetical protein